MDKVFIESYYRTYNSEDAEALPLFFSQIIARVWLRGHHNMIALWFRMTAGLWLGISLIVLILVLIAEPVLGFSAFAPAVVAQWVIGIAAALLIYAVYNALTPTVVTVPLTSAKLKKPLRQGSI